MIPELCCMCGWQQFAAAVYVARVRLCEKVTWGKGQERVAGWNGKLGHVRRCVSPAREMHRPPASKAGHCYLGGGIHRKLDSSVYAKNLSV
jgi:hypothetical protein